MTEAAESPVPNHRSKIYGHKKVELMHLLAKGDHTFQQLADMFGVSKPGINSFQKRNLARITQIRERLLTDSVAGPDRSAELWVTEKHNRLAEYQYDIDYVNKLVYENELLLTPSQQLQFLKVKHTALLRVAEELGQLPQRVTASVEGKQAVYIIKGVDPKDVT